MHGFLVAVAISVSVVLVAAQTVNKPSIERYTKLDATCEENEYATDVPNLNACAKKCFADPQCVGFQFTFPGIKCSLREKECDKPVPSVNAAFYLKGLTACEKNNEGTEFIFGYMTNRAGRPQNLPLEIFVTHKHPVPITVQVQTPNGISDQTVEVPAGAVVKIEVDSSLKMTDLSEQGGGFEIENKGIRMSAPSSFIMYGANKDLYTTDAWLGLPTVVADTEFYAACHAPAQYVCEFAVVAQNRDTKVSITLPNANQHVVQEGLEGVNSFCSVEVQGRTYSSGETFEVTIQRLEMLQLQAACDLSSTKIVSSSDITFYSGNARSNIGRDTLTRDHLVEQFPGVQAWGTDCFATPTPGRTVADYWSVTSREDATIVIEFQDGSRREVQLVTGGTYRFQGRVAEPMMIKANDEKQIMVVQYVHSQIAGAEDADPATILCTPSAQFGFKYQFATPTSANVNAPYKNHVTVVTREGKEGGLRLDGRRPDYLYRWKSVGNHGLVTNSFDVESGSYALSHNDRFTNFGAYVYGAGDRESYAFPTGMCVRVLKCARTQMVIADSKDNDCDGVVDEEICDGQDDDGDGEIDEDCIVKQEKPKDFCWDIKEIKACYNSVAELRCESGKKVKIVDAHFGRIGYKDEDSCGAGNPVDEYGREISCGLVDIYWPLVHECATKESCKMAVNLYTMGNILNPNTRCQLCNQYAWIHYTCIADADVPRYWLAGRHGAELPDRYTASSFNYGSGSIPGTCANAQATYSWPSTACPGCDAAGRLATADMTSPSSARFSVSSTHAWCPALCDKTSAWLQMDLNGHYDVTGYLVQGRRMWENWVVTFGLAFSSDGVTWNELRNGDGTWKVFDANSDARSIKWCTINDLKIVARYVRFYVLSYSGQPCLHFDVSRGIEHRGCEKKTIDNSNFREEPGRRGTVSTVKCNYGWETDGGSSQYQVKCDNDGRWQETDDSKFLNCSRAKRCADIPNVPNALHNGRNTNLGAEVTYKCQSGKRMEGDALVRCQQDATWSVTPRCT